MKLTRRIRELIGILNAEDLDEIEVRTPWSAVRIARRRPLAAREVGAAEGSGAATTGAANVASEPAAAPASEQPGPQGQIPVTPAPSAQLDLEEIRSPMVGTFYRSSNPEADPYVVEGTRVDVGQVLCVIEAMKLMNEIESERSCVIRKILVQDSQPVEFDQPLFLVESA